MVSGAGGAPASPPELAVELSVDGAGCDFAGCDSDCVGVVTGSEGAEAVAEPVMAGADGVLSSALSMGSISVPPDSFDGAGAAATALEGCGLGGLRTMRPPELPPPTEAMACE
jgi:hypothetical protein